jgi:hypothetical protein
VSVSCSGGEVPGEQLVDAIDPVICDAGQDLMKIAFWTEPIEFGRADQRLDDGGMP